MINKIATLSAQLRKKDLPVSIRSTQAAVQIYKHLGESDRNLLKTALMAVYVKDKYDIVLGKSKTICEFKANNPTCLKDKCPYFR